MVSKDSKVTVFHCCLGCLPHFMGGSRPIADKVALCLGF